MAQTSAASSQPLEVKVAAFAAWCARSIRVHGDPPAAEYIEQTEIGPIKTCYRNIFGHDPSGATVVRIVSREYIHEVGDGWAAHIMCEPPDYLVKAIELCGVETEVRQAKDVLGCNAPPNTAIRVWRLH